jgi:hypothetical protein
MSEMTARETTRVVVHAKAGPEPLCSLPFVGETTIEDAAFYGVLGVLAGFELVCWPTALLIGTAHVLHQRVRRIGGTRRGEAIEGTLEATEELV